MAAPVLAGYQIGRLPSLVWFADVALPWGAASVRA